jgi:uncharacterized protein YndB with AHSA1/START domain
VSDELRRNGAALGVHLERDYDGTPEELWQCWTDPVRLGRWLGIPARPLMPAAEPVRLVMGDGKAQWVEVRVLAADQPRTLKLAWDLPGQPGTELTVEFVALSPGRTRVVVDHDGLGESATGYGAGWQAYLEGGLLRETGGRAGAPWEHRLQEALPAWRERAAATG